MLSAVLVMFIMAFLIYSKNVSEGNEINGKMAATNICTHISSDISSMASLGGTSEHVLDLPETLNGRNYTIWIISERNRIDINYQDDGEMEPAASCGFHVPDVISCNGSSVFMLEKNATLKNYGGEVCVEQ